MGQTLEEKHKKMFVDLMNEFNFIGIAAIFVALIDSAPKDFIEQDTLALTFRKHLQNFLDELKPKEDA